MESLTRVRVRVRVRVRARGWCPLDNCPSRGLHFHNTTQTRKAVAKEKDSKGGVFDLPIQMVVA